MNIRASLLKRINPFGFQTVMGILRTRSIPKANLQIDYAPHPTVVGCDLGLKFLYYQVDPDGFFIFSHYPFPPGTVQSQLIVEFGLTIYRKGARSKSHPISYAISFHAELALKTREP